MTLAEFAEDARKKLLPVCHDEREAENILRILMEDVLLLKNGELKQGRELSESETAQLTSIVERLRKNEPLQYVLGSADFFGMKFIVNPHVLIPRPETEELVDFVIKTLKPVAGSRMRLIDIGAGSGCIAITLKKNLPEAEVLGVDKSEDAVHVAMKNDKALKGGVDFLTIDFLDNRSWETLGVFDVIVSNPPYVTKWEFLSLMERVRDYEPREALIAEGDEPFIFYNKIAEFGKKHLTPSGYIFVELNSAHTQEISSIFLRNGYRKTVVKKDLQGNDRMLEVRR